MTLKTFARVAVVSALFASSVVLAEETADGSGMRRANYLLDASDQRRPFRLDVHAVIPYGYLYGGYFPIGVGATFYVPIVHNGFIPPVNDEFGIDFGADAIFYPGYNSGFFAAWLPVAVLWTFHFTPSFAAYVKLGFQLGIWPGSNYYGPGGLIYASPISAVGLNWMFGKNVGLRLEAGYPAVKLGIIFAF